METKITRQKLFQAVAELVKDKLTYHGPLGPRYVEAGDIAKFKDWTNLADKLGLPEEPKIFCSECGAEKRPLL